MAKPLINRVVLPDLSYLISSVQKEILFLFKLLTDGEYQETEGDFISIIAVV